MRAPTAVALALVAVSFACARPKPPAPASAHRAVYYWRTTLPPTDLEARAVERLAIDRIYLRVFDVDVAPGAPAPHPVAPLTGGDAKTFAPTVELVPVIFMRERVFRQLDAAASATLADEAWRALTAVLARVARAPREIQIDCDWTDTTRETFFAWLRRFEARAAPATLSATIRLHQIKYRERTGVPPVARGMLMFYNMGAIDADPDGPTSIFDEARAQSYLARVADYPLPLDVALPIFSWAVHVRGEHVESLLQSTDPAGLDGRPFLARVGPHRFRVNASSFLDGVLLREGDFLDVEKTTTATTARAAAMLAPRLSPMPRTLALFHLSEKDLAHHDLAALVRLF